MKGKNFIIIINMDNCELQGLRGERIKGIGINQPDEVDHRTVGVEKHVSTAVSLPTCSRSKISSNDVLLSEMGEWASVVTLTWIEPFLKI